MKRNPLLRSALLALVWLLTVWVAAEVQPVMAQGSSTTGSLLALNQQGQPVRECPLKHTQVKTEISGFLARVSVIQHFENPFPDKIEAVYTFPLPQAAAVDDMTIVVGNRTIKGKIMRREEAQATYDAARAKGQVAALLNQQRPNIFTQSVANILPGQQISVTISYVETLEYEGGTYEWSFPMVVGPRYIPASVSENRDTPEMASSQTPEPTPISESSSDAGSITPPVMPEGMRAGHDVSIEILLDTGVPIVAFRSETHEIEAVQPVVSKATVRLKEQTTIPNKDFVFKYDVAGNQISDALLMHRNGNDGYFTFILQPPRQVAVADVTPKELVFVLDTSGSMSGFPIEKAKETMMLALDGLYAQDTFNLILFSGDTKILFSDPMPATPENVNKAKKLLASAQGEGGTEMMKAIRAALKPSDAQGHVRITCFMTDGMVGDDMEIIAEVQKHPNARVFAMGFGSSPNRFLLNKITEYGRGEVEYVTEAGDTKTAAKRFYERVRNPLLTDVSIDWSGLPVTEVFPKIIPDLFSAKPLVLSGRYTGGGKGVIRLKGMMSGVEFIREIPVELPDQQTQHDVLATLWARRKIDDLMGQDMSGAQIGNMRADLKSEITKLGLAYRMMTRFTSFVAVEDQSMIDGLEPRRVEVPVEAPAGAVSYSNFSVSGVNATVTVTAGVVSAQTSGSTVSTSYIQTLPVVARSVQSLSLLAPGSVAPARGDSTSTVNFNVSINGQRPSSNQFTIDGVSGNFGTTPGGQSPGASATGAAPALTATGATNPLAPFGAIQEVAIHTFAKSAEYDRNSGGLLSLVTKAGTNSFHGSAFEFFNHHALNANDWFANSRGLAKPVHGSNEFGGTIGGPIQRDRFFFFAAYEGLRLRQAVTSLTDVPSQAIRDTASSTGRQVLNLYPLPTGPVRPDGFAESAANFVDRGGHDGGSLRLDRIIGDRLTLRSYYNFTDSEATERGSDRFSLNTVGRLFNRSQLLTGSADFTLSPTVAGEIKVGYSHFTSRSSYQLDDFGGAVIPPVSVFSQAKLFANHASLNIDLNGRNTNLLSAADAASKQRQLQALGSIALVSGNHTFKFGANYRRMLPVIGLREHELSALFAGPSQALTGEAARVSFFERTQPQRPTFNNLSVYAQDDWRKNKRLTFSYGLRWDLNLAPRASDRRNAVTGTRMWATTLANFAPRLGIAYQLNEAATLIVRGGFGVFYDNVNSAAGDAFADSYPFLNVTTNWGSPFSLSGTSPILGAGPPVVGPFSAFVPRLKLPYSLQWHVSVERELGSRQVISASYIASANRRSLLTSSLLHATADFEFVRSTNNEGRSDYRALQLQFDRRFSNRLGAMVSYTWGRSTDNFSDDSPSRALFRAIDSRFERGPSDFDVRHRLTGFLSYEIPQPLKSGIGKYLLQNWTVDSLFDIHSAHPVNVVYKVPTGVGFIYLRPDAVADVPLYVVDPLAAGGRRINPDAFAAPPDFRQGTLGRNMLRGFPFSDINLALRRRINFTEELRMTFGVEALNVLNHPNFAAPGGDDASLGTRFDPSAGIHRNPTFGQSFTNASRSPWGMVGNSFGASYYAGGARTLRLSVKFDF